MIRLPGIWRGVFSRAGLWLGNDHLLSVKSDRFHESYKRFYLRDIQAIVVTKAPRFVFSSIHLAALFLLFVLLPPAGIWLSEFTGWLWLLPFALAGAWIYFSLTRSCSCRLYTAVSREDLPSIYRLRTARKFLARIEPEIASAQGALPEGWAEAAEVASPGGKAASLPSASRSPARTRTAASLIFLSLLFVEGALTGLDVYSPITSVHTLMNVVTLAEVAAAFWVIIQANRRVLRPAMQRIAMASVVLIGLALYAQTIAGAVQSVRSQTVNVRQPGARQQILRSATEVSTIRLIYVVGCNVLFMAGIALSFMGEDASA